MIQQNKKKLISFVQMYNHSLGSYIIFKSNYFESIHKRT